jgi:hypothetical protein
MKGKLKIFAALGAVAAVFAAMQIASATALTDNVATPQRDGSLVSLTQASNHIYAGSIVAVDSAGKAVPASDATGLKVVGRAEVASDNVTAATYSATKALNVRRGVFRWANGGSFTDAHVGDLAYVADDQTVTTAASVTYDIVAGVIIDVDTDGVWVDTFAVGGQGAASVTTFTASGTGNITGNATLGGTLAVAGATIITGATTITGAVTAVGNAAIGGNTIATGTLISTGLVTGVAGFLGPTVGVSTSGVKVGDFKIIDGTNLVFIVGTVTNSIDGDIGN